MHPSQSQKYILILEEAKTQMSIGRLTATSNAGMAGWKERLYDKNLEDANSNEKKRRCGYVPKEQSGNGSDGDSKHRSMVRQRHS